MDDNIRFRNLNSITAEFYDQTKAALGFKLLNKLILENKSNEIDHLLRYHIPIGVYGQELVKRFEIDALIEFYNTLLVGVIAGYLPPQLNPELRQNILIILGNQYVKPYYMNRYRYTLTIHTLQLAEGIKTIHSEENLTTISAFHQFIALNRVLKKDNDIQYFLGMIDYVFYGIYSLSDLIEVLSSEKKMSQIISFKQVDSVLHSSVWGFIKYTAFLSQMRQLLEETTEYPLLQSAMWQFHGYYFQQFNSKMRIFFDQAFTSLEKTLFELTAIQNLAGEIFEDEVPEEFDESELKQMAEIVIAKTKNDIEIVLNKEYGNPLEKFFRTNN